MFGRWFNRLTRQRELPIGAPPSSPETRDLYARVKLFRSFLGRQDDRMRFLPGFYGGPVNSDQLAYQAKDSGEVVLFLGIKSLEPDGGLQLDTNSLGGFVQFSREWLEALIRHLSSEAETCLDAQTIADAWAKGVLVTVVLLVRRGGSGNELAALRIETPSRDLIEVA